MSYQAFFMWWIAPFIIVLLIGVFLSKFFWARLWGKPAWVIGASLCGITHVIMATMTALYIASGLQRERLLGMAWALFVVGDYPITFFIRPMIEFFNSSTLPGMNKSFWISDLLVPYVLFATLGSLQYCLLGGLLGKILEPLQRPHRSTRPAESHRA